MEVCSLLGRQLSQGQQDSEVGNITVPHRWGHRGRQLDQPSSEDTRVYTHIVTRACTCAH